MLVASDMHLEAGKPALTQRFLTRLEALLQPQEAIVLAGDLFEAWVGDDQPDAAADALARLLAKMSRQGSWIGVMHGNRDFLLGAGWCLRAQAHLLPDPVRINLGPWQIALSHGDQWVTEDHAYQQARVIVRSSDWQQRFLAQPLQARLEFASQQRKASETHKAQLSAAIMDVAAGTINEAADALATEGINLLVHGHTHRPAVHTHRSLTRYVLEDWCAPDRGAFLRISPDEIRVVR